MIIKLLINIFCCILLVHADDVPDTVCQLALEAVSGKLSLFNESNFENRKTNFGFNKDTKVSDLKVGTPIKVYIANFQEFIADNNYTTDKLNCLPCNWYFPVIANGEIKVFFTIRKENNVWQPPTGYGKTLLAAEWNLINKSWPISMGYNPVMIQLVGSHHYLHIPEVDKTNLTYINTHRGTDKSLSKKMSSEYYTTLKHQASELRSLYNVKEKQQP
jgi:hypothetical protein